MAVRGINPLEKHVEKIFLALAAAGLTGVVAWQVAGGAGTVEVGTEKEVPADQAYAKLEGKAKQLQGQMREPNPSIHEKLTHSTDLKAEFQKRLAANVAPAKQFAWKTEGLKIDVVPGSGTTTSDQFFLPPNLPMALKPIAHPFMSTVNESELTGIPELAKYMPAKAPLDKAAVSVETTIDPKAIRAAMENDPDGPGPAQPLLRAWWANTEVVGVEMVRQEMKPDGTWGGETATAVLPGRKSFDAELKDPQIDTARLGQIVFDASAASEELERPEWYKRADLGGYVVGEEWKSPSEIAKAGDAPVGGPLEDNQRKLRELLATKARLEGLIANKKNEPARPNQGGGGGGLGAGGGGGHRAGGGGGGGGGGGSPGTPRPDPKEEQLKILQKQLDRVNALIAETQQKIADLGGKADAAAPKPVVKDADLSILLSTPDPITIWHHDVEATRGATYRYQLRVKISNPLFNRPGQLQAKDAAVAKSPTLTIPCADWSDPVHVDDEVYCFITGANAGANSGGLTGMGTAQATLLFYTWGYWRSDHATLEPGDGMVAHWKVPDETKINAAPAPGAAPPPPAGAAPGGRRPGAAIGGGGAPAGAPAAPLVPANTPLPSKEITKERDAFLLDVVTNPVSRKGSGISNLSFMALIRDIDKSIIARDPEAEKASPLFNRLEASVKAGVAQMAGQGTAPVGGPGNPVPPGNIPPPMNNPGLNPGHGLGGG